MKKANKILAGTMAAVIVGTAGAVSASAEIAGTRETVEYIYDYNGNEGVDIVQSVSEKMYYQGIVVTMADSSEPDKELLGTECEITKYDDENAPVTMSGTDWSIGSTVETGENKYFIDTSDTMTEDEAAEYAKKLVLYGKVSEAQVLYSYHKGLGSMYIFDKRYVTTITFDSAQSAEKFADEEHTELDDYAFSIGKIVNQSSGNYLRVEFDQTKAAELGLTGVERYEELLKIGEKLKETHSEIQDFTIQFSYSVSDESIDAVYDISPLWGDITGDDKIDVFDAVNIAKHTVGAGDFTEEQKLIADYNRDGNVDVFDAISVAKKTVE